MVELLVANEKVARSNRVTRSISPQMMQDQPCIILILAAYPSGKGEVCKTFMRRFESGRRLHSAMKTAILFNNGRSQAVWLPKEFRFEGDHLLIKREGNIVLRIPEKKSRDSVIGSFGKFTDDFIGSFVK